MRWPLRYQWSQTSSWFEVFIPITIEPHKIKKKAPKSRIFIEEVKEETKNAIDYTPSKQKLKLPPINNKLIMDDAT